MPVETGIQTRVRKKFINETIYHGVLDLRGFSQLGRRTSGKLDPNVFSKSV